MAIFNRFPFSNAHELNLDWILRQIKDLLRRVKILEQSGGGGGGGTSDYTDLTNKPSINGVQLVGNKTTTQLKLDEIYWASYGNTTYAEIGDALNSGKLPVCYYSGQYYIYSYRSGSTRYFVTAYTDQILWIRVDSSNVWNYSNSPMIPSPASVAPQMDGDAAVGSSSKYARENHVHPSDSTKITMPSGGSTGQVLKKTLDGVEWANESGGGGTPAGWDKIVDITTTSEVSSLYGTFDATARQKILDASEILFVNYFVPTTDSSKTAKGKFTQRISTSATYGIYLRPDYNTTNIVPAYNNPNNMPRITHYQKAGPLDWFPNNGDKHPYIKHVGYSNSNNPSISTATSWTWEESHPGYRNTIDRLYVETDTLFGIGSNFRLYVR